MGKKSEPVRPIRYAVVGQGYFAQVAVLPAFAHAPGSELTALVSDDPVKLAQLGEQYQVPIRCTYDEIDGLLTGGTIDAVYIALPNDMHAELTLRAAAAGVHVLCEKPMALSELECQAMISAAVQGNVKLMIGYRLHFEAGNLTAIDVAQNGEIGEPRLFSSVFSMQVREGNTRLLAERGGGALNDIGIYCINAARYIFRNEPVEVLAMMSGGAADPRFREVEESVAVTMRFPGDRLASFVASFGAADVARYEVVGTDGVLIVDGAYEFASDIKHQLVKDGKSRTRTFKKRDQVAAELVYFSRCIREDLVPEPSGWEGLADVRIMDAIRKSAATGRSVPIAPVVQDQRPDLDQEIHVRPHGEPRLVHASPPTKG